MKVEPHKEVRRCGRALAVNVPNVRVPPAENTPRIVDESLADHLKTKPSAPVERLAGILSREIQRMKERYRSAAYTSLLKSSQSLSSSIAVPFQPAPYSRRTMEAYEDQWPNQRPHGFDWPEIWRRHRDPDMLHLAVWSDERLSALSLFRPRGKALEVSFLEGDIRPECPLRGRRALIVIECAASYAQAIGKKELRICPTNDTVRTLYVEVFGFEEVNARGTEPHFRLGV